jgi:hypothetical protein
MAYPRAKIYLLDRTGFTVTLKELLAEDEEPDDPSR